MNTDQLYSNKTRIRVCGLLEQANQLLLIKHVGLGREGYIWSPPGGGVEFREHLEDALRREFLEETGLEVETAEFLFINEFMDRRFHAIEMFFAIKNATGNLLLGHDPEVTTEDQILKEVKFISWEGIRQISPYRKHNVFRFCNDPRDVMTLKGIWSFKDN